MQQARSQLASVVPWLTKTSITIKRLVCQVRMKSALQDVWLSCNFLLFVTHRL